MECLVIAKRFYFGIICPQNILLVAFWLLHMVLIKLKMGRNVLFEE